MNMVPLAIPYEQPRVQYNLGANPGLLYAIPWKFWMTDGSDLMAVVTQPRPDGTIARQELTIGTDYNLNPNPPADPNASYYDGGMVILNAQWPNTSLTFWRVPVLRRVYDISPTGPLDVKMLNAQLDQTMTTLQDIQLQINAGYGRDYTELGNQFLDFVLPTPEDGMMLAWSGEYLINIPITSGPMGPQGPQGEPGLPGPMGPQGEAGIAGQATTIVFNFGVTRTPNDLPSTGYIPAGWDAPNIPATNIQMIPGQALLYNLANPANPLYGHLIGYVSTSAVLFGWIDLGIIVGGEGPQGPMGPQGAAGQPGPEPTAAARRQWEKTNGQNAERRTRTGGRRLCRESL